MRNFKKLTSVVVALALVITTFTQAFAAYTAVNGDKAIVLNKLELYAGTSASTFEPSLETELTRGQGAILLAKLFNMDDEALAMTDAEATEILKGFDDASEVPGYAKNRLAYLVKNEIMSGALDTATGKTYINADESLLGGQYATLILKQLGFTVLNWKEAVAQLSNVDGAKDLAQYVSYELEALLRDQAVGTMFGTLTAEYADGLATVIEKIIAAKPELKAVALAEGLIAPEVTELAVESVTATNYRELVVTFNKAVDAALLGDKANYTVTDKTIAFAEAAADNKSVTLFLTANIAGGTSATVTVNKAIMGTDTAVVSAAIMDATLPSVVSVIPVGNSALEVTFSEPVQTIGNSADYKLDGLFFAQSVVPSINTAAGNGKVVTITPVSRLTAGAHTLTVSSTVTDYAGYGLTVNRVISFTIAADSTPASVSYTSATQTEVVVTFSEPVVKATIEAAAITFTNGITKNVATLADDKVTLTVTVNGAIPVGGTTSMTIPKASIVDTFGNVAATDAVIAFIGVADVERPAVTSVAFAKDVQNKLYVEFSKAVALDGTYTLTETKSDATTVVTAPAPAYFIDTTVTPNVTVKTKLVLTGAYDSTSSYSLVIKNVTDTPNPLANKILDYVASGLVVADLTAPVYAAPIVVNGQSMYISFNDAIVLPATTAFVYVKADNSIVNGLPSGATVALVNNNKTVKLTFKTAIEDTTNGLDPATLLQIQYTGLVGADGNAVAGGVVLKAAFATVGVAPTLGAVEVTGAHTVTAVVTNPTNLVWDAGQALNDFTLYNTVTTSNIYNLVNATFDTTTNKITFTTYEVIGTDAKIATETLTLASKATTSLSDIFGQKFAVSQSAVASDKFAATVSMGDLAAGATSVVLTLSEATKVDGALISAETLTATTASTLDATTQFTVLVDGVAVAATFTQAAGDKTITMAIAAVTAGKVVTVNYYKSPVAGKQLVDAGNNTIANFTLTKTVQ